MIPELIQLGSFSWVQEVWYDWSDGRNACLRIDVDSNSCFGSQYDLSNAQVNTQQGWSNFNK